MVASRYETLRLLVAFAQEHKLARLQDRQTLAEALEQLDSHYMTQHTALRNGLDTLAWLTDEELLRVQQEMVYMQANESLTHPVSEIGNDLYPPTAEELSMKLYV